MKRVLFLGVLVLAVSALPAKADSACASGFFSDYTASGFTCTIDGLRFSDFSYAASGGGGATPVSAEDIRVTVGSTGISFLFSAPWSVSAGQSLDSLLGYTVTALDGPIIEDLSLSMIGFAFSGNGTVGVAENAFSNGVNLANLFVFSNSNHTRSTDAATFSPVNSLTLSKDIVVRGNTEGDATVSGVTNAISVVNPEPGTLTLFGSGLISIAVLIRRKLKK